MRRISRECGLTLRGRKRGRIIHGGVKCSLLSHPAVCLMQGAELPAEAVSGLPGGAGGPAGVGERGAASADHQPGSQLLLRPVSVHSSHHVSAYSLCVRPARVWHLF